MKLMSHIHTMFQLNLPFQCEAAIPDAERLSQSDIITFHGEERERERESNLESGYIPISCLTFCMTVECMHGGSDVHA